MDLKDWKINILEASKRISKYIEPTPVQFSSELSQCFGCNVWLKLECNNLSGSFKIRGAFNKSIILTENSTKESVTKIVTASSGNHGSACCEAWKHLNCQGELFVPHSITEYKMKKFQMYSDYVKVKVHGDETGQSEIHARQYANQNSWPYISPYNDYDVICGQGTISVELIDQIPQIDAVIVPCGGGGLLGGVSTFFKSVSHPAKIIACQPEKDAVMFHSIKADRILSYEEAGSQDTICQATAGGVEFGSLTFELCKANVDDWFLLTEYEVAKALQELNKAEPHLRVEPSCVLPLAALKKCFKNWTGKTVVLVVTSSNVGDAEIANAYKLCTLQAS